MPFFIIFIIIPLTEIAVFMAVGEHIGLMTTLLLALLTAIIGGFIVKYQGFMTIVAMREAMNQGKIPLSEIFDGFCLIAAGATLITPGFVTDTIGFLLLVPAVRNLIRTGIKNHTNWFVDIDQFHAGQTADPNVIEGEYKDLDDR